MPRDAVSRTANAERTGRHKWDAHKHNEIALLSGIDCQVYSQIISQPIQFQSCNRIIQAYIA